MWFANVKQFYRTILTLIGSGLGPTLAGILFDHNYQIVVLITMGIGVIGALFWSLAALWIKKDVNRISEIINKRASELIQHTIV